MIVQSLASTLPVGPSYVEDMAAVVLDPELTGLTVDDRQQLSPFPFGSPPISPRAVPSNPSLRQAAGPLVGHSARR